ncbi:MAG: hypothetical protein JSV42_18155 [Chloroflexota bacterium]|nr:MAG: hypothetical protein JSV42_18155 [Chloroflexota bacterium]
MHHKKRDRLTSVASRCAALHDPETGRDAIYYGGADTEVSRVFARIDELQILSNQFKKLEYYSPIAVILQYIEKLSEIIFGRDRQAWLAG